MAPSEPVCPCEPQIEFPFNCPAGWIWVPPVPQFAYARLWWPMVVIVGVALGRQNRRHLVVRGTNIGSDAGSPVKELSLS